ncbi:MAG: Gfo/Idh/MocA family oxidoreductase [Planctomycetota bacterium]
MPVQQQSEIGIGVIGLGERMRGVLGQVLESDQRIKLRAVCDPSPAAHAWARNRTDSEPVYEHDVEGIVKRSDVDWVMVGSWNCHHAEHILAAVHASKHVFTEKPLATSWGDCLKVRDALAASNTHFFFGLVLRYSPHCQKIHDLVHEGRIGRLISFEFNETLPYYHGGYIHSGWRRFTSQAGSHILEKCCHDLDLANWITDSVPRRVASFGGRDIFIPENQGLNQTVPARNREVFAYEEWQGPDSVNPFTGGGDIMDHQVCILEYRNGIRGTFHTNANAGQPERRFYLLGTEGSLRADVVTGRIELTPVGANQPNEDHSVACEDMHAGGDAVLVKSLVQTMLHGRPPCASIADALNSSIAAFGIDTACEEGSVAVLDEMYEQLLSSSNSAMPASGESSVPVIKRSVPYKRKAKNSPASTH